MNTSWVLVADVTDPDALAGYYRTLGDVEAAQVALEEGRSQVVVDICDWEDEAEAARVKAEPLPGVVFRVEQRRLGLDTIFAPGEVA